MLADVQIISDKLGFRPNKNQAAEITRLVFEVCRRERLTPEIVLAELAQKKSVQRQNGNQRFNAAKRELIQRRFPLTSSRQKIGPQEVFLAPLPQALPDCRRHDKKFHPEKIFLEKDVENSELARNLRAAFPDTPRETIERCDDYRKRERFQINDLKKSLVFIVKERRDFLKPCPCTKKHIACGYWILNLGFGCPFDCAYCFLQVYANFPGIILPANLDDFFEKFDAFHKKLKKPIRIGTGEFCDSLALDHLTGYTKKLVPYFKDKNVFFELKTKSGEISNLLDMPASPNIVISWSLNPQAIITDQELGTATLLRRLEAAKKIQEKGYSLAFHFDPIIHFDGWEKQYKRLLDSLYAYVKPPLAWISLGTLRCHRGLKTVAEARFPQSDIFYGELLLGQDQKLRYPKSLRKTIYAQMDTWIKHFDKKTPVYLCMEDKECWETPSTNFRTP